MPGHWNTLANYVTDHPLSDRRIGGVGEELDALEYEVKLYLALNGAVHDAAVAGWGAKAIYDYVRPISMIRHMGGLGTFAAPADDFLEFERGPSVPITLQWATYQDAADEAGLSRLHGGIHVRADDFNGRVMGDRIGNEAYDLAEAYWNGTAAQTLRR
jgi:hypothetical protein